MTALPPITVRLDDRAVAMPAGATLAQLLALERREAAAVATALNPFIGYDKATEIVKEAVASRRTIREVAIEKGIDEATLDEALDLRKMARGSQA